MLVCNHKVNKSIRAKENKRTNTRIRRERYIKTKSSLLVSPLIFLGTLLSYFPFSSPLFVTAFTFLILAPECYLPPVKIEVNPYILDFIFLLFIKNVDLSMFSLETTRNGKAFKICFASTIGIYQFWRI